MQADMHYYGTYAMARAAGLSIKNAKIIAYAAQYVDDSTAKDSEVHPDGGMFQTVATAHSNSEAIANAAIDQAEQRRVWVPFHFFPGNQGNTLSEKLVCQKNSALAREMVDNHVRHALSDKCQYKLSLMGITAHVYADTFSHYGFSGVSSSQNKVDGSSFEMDVKDPEVKAYIMGKLSGFFAKYPPRFILTNYRRIASGGASAATGALGHGAVGTYPDRPFLRWRFKFLKDNGQFTPWRDNKETFLEGCEKLHEMFCQYANGANRVATQQMQFSDIKAKVAEIISLEAAKDERIKAWRAAIESGALFPKVDGEEEASFYSEHEWEQQKDFFDELPTSAHMIDKDVYKFHQAATYHRDYTLKQLLPKCKIAVL